MHWEVMRYRILLMMVGLAIAFQESPKPAKKQHGAECDASCQAFREVLEAGSQQFRPLRGAQIAENRWQTKVIVPVFSSGVCEVQELPPPVQGMGRWGGYFCQLPAATHDSAIKQFQSVLVSLQAALPKEWHTESFEDHDEKTPTFRAGPSSDELYLVLSCISDERGFSLTFEASSRPIPTD